MLRGWRGRSCLYPLVVLADLLMGMVLTAVPLRAVQLQADPVIIGGLGSGFAAVYVSCCFLAGHLSDRWGRGRLVMVSGPGCVAASIILASATSVPRLYLGVIILAPSLAIYWPTLEAWLAETPGRHSLLRRVTLFNVCWSMAWIIGPPVGGRLLEVSTTAPFWAAAGLGGVMTAMLAYERRRPREVSFHPRAAAGASGPVTADGRTRQRYVWAGWMANLSLYFAVAAIRYHFPKLGVELQLAPSHIGLLLGCVAVGQLTVFLFLGWWSSWRYRPGPLLAVQSLALAGLLLLTFVTVVPYLFLAVLLVGAGLGMTYSSSLFYSLDSRERRGARAGIHETMIMSGNLAGPFLGGVLASRYTLQSPYALAAAVMVAALITQTVLVWGQGARAMRPS